MAQGCAAKRYVYVWQGPVRITHWINFFCMLFLSVTGFYIHYPFVTADEFINAPYIMGTVRYIHYIVGIVFAMSIIIRFFWLFVGNKYASWRSFSNPFNKKDRDVFFKYLKYYSFLGKDAPHTIGHNPVALVAYIVLFNLMILQCFSGFALWAQAHPDGLMYSLTGWIFGILSNQWVRFYHYLFMFLVAGFFINHIYSAVLFDFKSQSGEISSIFSGWKPERRD